MRPMGLRLTILLLLTALAVLGGCPNGEGDGGDGAADSGFEPSAPIPIEGPLLGWADLRLGMSSFEISQVYNAPEGRGEGFTRVLQEYGSSMTQLIEFDRVEAEPERVITCALYRDQLFMLVDRREGLSTEQAEELRQECIGLFGEPVDEPVAGAQWGWGSRAGVQATFTQDNASELYMTVNLVIEHVPTRQAWHDYNAAWDARQEQAEQ